MIDKSKLALQFPIVMKLFMFSVDESTTIIKFWQRCPLSLAVISVSGVEEREPLIPIRFNGE